MSKAFCPSSRALTVLCALLAAALFSLAAAAPSSAKGCAEGSPVLPVPAALWAGSELKPAGIISDASRYNGNQLSDSAYPQITAVDIENGYLFASYWSGFQIWDVNGANAAVPVKKVIVDGWSGHNCRTPSGEFPSWPGCSEFDAWIWALDAPTGDDSLVALGGESPVGFSIFNTTNKVTPNLSYQDPNRSIHQVYSATISGRAYAFAADYESGIYVYDMTSAKPMNKCLDNAGHSNCPGVYKGKFAGGTTYVQGLQLGAKSLVVTSTGGGFGNPKNVELWDVSNPSAPTKIGTGYNGGVSFGAALFTEGGQTYLGVRLATTLDIVNVTSCVNSGCSSLPAPTTTVPNLRPIPESSNWKPVIASMSGTTPFLYLGHHDVCHDLSNSTVEPVGKEEYLFNVSNPSSPREVTPATTIVDTGKTVDYWSWYYSDSLRGYSFTAALGAKFNGPYLYRAGRTIFDIHEWTGAAAGPPQASFTWAPTTVYAGDPITFTDTTSGLVVTRDWSFQDGTPSVSSSVSQIVTFSPPGNNKSVSLTVSNPAFPPASTKTQLINVLDPAPVVQGVPNPPQTPVCGTVSWTANGVGGKPPLTISWTVKDAAQQQVATGSGNPFAWDTSGRAAGDYTGMVSVSNGAGAPATAFGTVKLVLPDPLPLSGQFLPANDSFSFGTVTFHANVPSATSWNWNFGDGAGYRGWTGPYAVANPTFTYNATGSYNVKVMVRNCSQPIEVESAALPVVITQVQPLTIGLFQAQCNFAPCVFSTNESVTFLQAVVGGPTQIQYDWEGNGSWDQTVPVTGQPAESLTHTYTQAGQYAPKIRVTRGNEPPVDYSHPTFAVQSSTPPPPPPTPTISITGPSSGLVGQSLSFIAGASLCTPSATWNWSTAGGTLTGSGSSVSITWSSEGNKTVSVTNTGCAGTAGTKSVSITTTPTGGGTLNANFTFSPASPNAGQAVSFDGSSSTGSPTVFSWDFGDGQTTSLNSATVSHTYANGGSYTVKLEVGKQGTGCPFGVCAATLSKTLTVGAGGPPPLQASFDSAACIADFAGVRCTAATGTPVTLTATTANATSYSWNFGDSTEGSGIQVSHTWANPGPYDVRLTVSDGRSTSSVTRNFTVTGEPTAGKKSVILPWIAESRGALVQSSDLYLLNPGTSAMDVTLTFLRRGQPEANPPKVQRTIQPGATLYGSDVLRQMFNQENITGFVTVEVDKGNVEPIITSFNTTFQSNGSEFGQTVPGMSLSSSGSPAQTGPGSAQVQSLIGLNANADRLAYFGLSNPSKETVSFTLRFFDNDGHQIGAGHDFAVPPLGHRQFLPKNVAELFGVTDQDDFRVEIRRTGAGLLYPFGANIRTGSTDPSFVGVGSSATEKVYLLGALSTPGINKSLWQSDVVLSNTSAEVVIADLSFTGAGAASQPTPVLHLTLQPGETQRLADVIGQQWGVRNKVGVITVDSNAPGGVFPIVQGESYENTNPKKRFGQSLPALTEAQAAGPGMSQYLAGLRQDAKNRTTIWIFNPGSQLASYDVVYLALDGHELGRINDVVMPAGRLQQLSPAQHKLPAAGVTDGFTVQVRVKSGKILAAAQVVKNATNDPAYVQGETR